MGNRRKDLFSQLDGLLGDAIELECANEKSSSSKLKYGGLNPTSSRSTNVSSNTSSIKNRIAMFENNDYDTGKKFSRRPSVASSTSSTRTIRTSPIQTIELTQPSASTLMKTRSRLTPYNSNNDNINSYNNTETTTDTIEDFLDSFNSSSNSDTENDEESTHTADTSIFSESPPPKSTAVKITTTSPTCSTPMTHKQFQNIIRIGTSTVDHLSGMLECMEAMVLSENDFIENELRNFTTTIQESAAHNTYIIKVFP
ncbi:hypothetical protein CLIB1423_01S06458 [[Candida] railenensis]|uniref:Uncharacterized protein n=1 Tax=[Candida] railenensis TaxID=45579 RepID=A0A9P0VWA2_9ASCO|nr:hypothetical protein CLIB1423_01S06458 [[Candida] railenensis]